MTTRASVLKSMFVLIVLLSISSQDLFAEEYGDMSLDLTGTETGKYVISGYIKSGIFSWDDEYRETYAEGAVKFEAGAGDYGKGFAELRYCVSSGNSEDESGFSIRETYADIYAGRLDIRAGRQIVVWGRADGFNPTNNITPADFTVFSTEEDDKRLSNFLVKAVYTVDPLKLEIDWVPVYRASELPFGESLLPAGVEWVDMEAPEKEPGNSSFGVKAEIETAAFDGSLSYFNGYYKTPGIDYYISQGTTCVHTKPFRTQVVGADFSTTAGRYGLRGEFALSLPEETGEDLSFPDRQLEYTAGIDSEWGNFSVILQYIGKYVIDHDGDSDDRDVLEKEISSWNRMIFSQQEQWNHSVSLRLSLSLLHETLNCEVLGLANFSTEEVYIQPKATYSIADAFELCAGAQLYYGPDDTLYGIMEKSKNALFLEIKKSY